MLELSIFCITAAGYLALAALPLALAMLGICYLIRRS